MHAKKIETDKRSKTVTVFLKDYLDGSANKRYSL